MASLPEIKILTCGRTGVGKSSLINFILGDDVCKARGPGNAGQSLSRVTTEVEGLPADMNGVRVTIFDSPGLQDGTPDEPKYLADMYEKCKDVDLVFYCLDMPTARWTPPEVKSIQLLTETFGGTFWDKVIFVLTRGNMVKSPQGKAHTREYFMNVQENLGNAIRAEIENQVRHLDVEQRPKNIDAIPAVPAGSKGKPVLSDEKHFIGHIWIACLERIQLDKVLIFVRATNSDERLVSYEDVNDIKEKSGERWLGYKPTKEDIAKALEAIQRRTKKTIYPLYMDKDDYERLKNIKMAKA